MNRRQKIIISVTGIFIVMLILVGLTYAYFLTQITGNTKEKSISVTTANLQLTYGDGNGVLEAGDKLRPGQAVNFKTSNGTTVNEKTFTVTNSGDDTSYVVIVDNVTVSPEPFKTNDFKYTLTCKSYEKDAYGTNGDNATETGRCDGVTDSIFFLKNESILVGNKIDSNIVHKYTLTMEYKETGQNQSADMGKTFTARINIEDIRRLKNPFEEGTLTYSIIQNAKDKKNGTELTNTPLTSPANEQIVTWGSGEFIYETINTNDLCAQWDSWWIGDSATAAKSGSSVNSYEAAIGSYVYDRCGEWTKYLESYDSATSILTFKSEIIVGESVVSIAEDNDGISYYYRGLPKDNYVNFAGMCWRIVRINGLGNTKLILEDQYAECDDTSENDKNNDGVVYIGAWDIEASDGTTITMNGSEPYRTGNFGYDHFDDMLKISYLNSEGNPDIAMSNAFKYFQTNTLSNKLNTLYNGKTISDYLVSGNWCLNNIAYSDEKGNTLLENPTYTSSFYYDSYVRLYGKTIKEPTLKCPVQTMEKFGDNTTLMYVATLTADEIVYAGAKPFDSYKNYYLINQWQVLSGADFWSLSPNNFNGFIDAVIGLDYDYGLTTNYVDGSGSGNYSFRPAVTLKSSVEILGGNGTKDNPYVVG